MITLVIDTAQHDTYLITVTQVQAAGFVVKRLTWAKGQWRGIHS